MIAKKYIAWIAIVIGISAVILDFDASIQHLVSRYAFPVLSCVFGVCVALTTYAIFRIRVRELEKPPRRSPRPRKSEPKRAFGRANRRLTEHSAVLTTLMGTAGSK
jgi:hypothetical protein